MVVESKVTCPSGGALPVPGTAGQPWRDVSDRAPQGAATQSIFGAGDSTSLRLCLCAAGNVHDCISSLIVFELGWVMIAVLLILHSLDSLHMALPLVLPVSPAGSSWPGDWTMKGGQ